MIITIDTKKDSPQDIRNAMKILEKYLEPSEERDSEILANIPKVTNAHRPSGPGVFDVRKTETPKEIQGKVEETTETKIEEHSSFKETLFSHPQENTSVSEEKESEEQKSKESIEYHGGRITRGTAPDFTSYLDLLKQKRERQMESIVKDSSEEERSQIF